LGVGGGLVDERLEHLGEAFGLVRRDREELCAVKEDADSVGGSEV
jgi:hypothetical protein